MDKINDSIGAGNRLNFIAQKMFHQIVSFVTLACKLYSSCVRCFVPQHDNVL